jgi:antitoxin component of MazEF toxin-antitoxin module
MSRLETNKIKVMVRKGTGQCSLTIPKQLVQAVGLGKGDIVSFQFLREGQFCVYKIAQCNQRRMNA